MKRHSSFNNTKELINFGVPEWINGTNYLCGENFCLPYKLSYADQNKLFLPCFSSFLHC